MRVTALQSTIAWEDKATNLERLRGDLERLHGETDLVVLPEMFSTGFSMNNRLMAEPTDGQTMNMLRQWAREFTVALTGSYIAVENGAYYNRGFFLTPDGTSYYRDKRHLFRMGEEADYFEAGNDRTIISYQGWNILLLICYDLRFPVWARNRNNEYDLLIYVANWPVGRRKVWDVLLQARAIENQCYVCGVNRVGDDGNGLHYDGGTVIYSPRGTVQAAVADGIVGQATSELSREALHNWRNKFAVWRDADDFTIVP
ncbi:MAG: amidohydrolase [Prevotellaceae bacterium]|jgi:predicted amidohydrolase|nr:amidohydrolase [Prevotellaceae bacterium]